MQRRQHRSVKPVRPVPAQPPNGQGTLTKRRTRGDDSVVIQITTNRNLVQVLDQAIPTGFYGTSRAAAAERLLAEAIRRLLTEGIIQKRQKAIE